MTNEEKQGFSYRIMQASPTELIVILYEMAESYVKQAIEQCEKKDIENFRMSLKYAGRVIDELNRSLDLKYEISISLMQVYMFVKKVMIRASVSMETNELKRCLEMLKKLETAFGKISVEDKRGPVMSNTQQVYAGLTYSKGSLNESFGLESNRGFRV